MSLRCGWQPVALTLVILVLLLGNLIPRIIFGTKETPHRPGVVPAGSAAPAVEEGHTEQVGLLVGNAPVQDDYHQSIISAYEAVLREEGFLHRRIILPELAALTAAERLQRYRAIILPENVNVSLPASAADILREYVEVGGKLLLVFDPGSRGPGGERLLEPLFAELSGVHYALPSSEAHGTAETYQGFWQFTSEATARAWGITPGKLDQGLALSTYSYGRMRFAHTRNRVTTAQELAFDSSTGARVAVLTQKLYRGGGCVVFANLRLGAHKLNSDDLTARSVLRTFLLRYAHLAHLMNTPQGKGGIVLNLHLDSNAHLLPLQPMIQRGVLRSDLAYSIHITAGPDNYQPGDGLGFDVGSPAKGQPWVEKLVNYGAIGAHGGWIHNYFAAKLNEMPREQVENYLRLNFDALENRTGQRVVEYSAPAGNHPPLVNHWLESRGALAYYSPGDTGSGPTRSMFKSRPVSGRLWSFPITPMRQYASMEDLIAAGVPEEEASGWLEDLLDFVEEHAVIRTIYTHANDREYSLRCLSHFSGRAAGDQASGKLLVWPMSRFAEFLNRHEQTTFYISRYPDGWRIDLSNPGGLKDLTTAVYIGGREEVRVEGSGVITRRENGWLYLTMDRHIRTNRVRIVCPQ